MAVIYKKKKKMSSVMMDDLKNMDGPLPGPLAQLKQLAQIGSVVMRMNNTQKMIFFAVILQVVASLSALSVTSSNIRTSVKGRGSAIFGGFLMAFAGMSAFYGMLTIPKIGMAASGQKIAMGGAALMTLGIISFSMGYATMKKDLGGDEDELKKALTMNILAILFSAAVFVLVAMKYHPVLPKSSFGSYDFGYY